MASAPSIASATGAATALGGTCPAITFTLTSTRVVTNQSTRFDDGGCTKVANGMTARAEGTAESDGSIRAMFVDDDAGGRQ